MPAIITHDAFGQEVYKEHYKVIGGSKDEYESFLIGNQGPDPLFYNVLVPRLHEFIRLGSTMHEEKPSELLLAFKQSLNILDDKEYEIGKAYVLGFLCHYTLDSSMHPWVYYNEYTICDAGVEGLDRKDGSEIHAAIESELDELVLFATREETVATFNPSTQILRGSDFVLRTISKMYAYVALVVYGLHLPKDMFVSSLKSFRRTQSFFYSKSGLKRQVVGRFEELFRRYSFYRAMSARPIAREKSEFDNRYHDTWTNPFTDETSDLSFWDIYHDAIQKAEKNIESMLDDDFDLEDARSLTQGLDFSGKPADAVLTIEED